MKYFILAVGYDDKKKKPLELIIGTFPWSEPKVYNLIEALELKGKIENGELTEHLDLVGTSGDIRKYTSYIKSTNDMFKHSYVIIAKAKAFSGDVYFVSDGTDKPLWLNVEQIKANIQKNGIGLANGKLADIEDDYTIEKIGKDFIEVDYKQSQLEYRQYLKGINNVVR